MKNYDFIIDNSNNKKICIIFSTNYISPISMLNDIQKDFLEKLKDFNEIYFDLLLCNKNSSERFAKIVCQNGIFDINEFSYLDPANEFTLREISKKYYINNAKNVDWTYVSSSRKALILNQI